MDQEAARLVPLSPHAALLLRSGSEKTLVVSDLHIGWEVSLSEKGVHVPSQTWKLMNRLRQLLELEKPDRLLILGDVRYAVEKIGMEEWRDVPDFFAEACKLVPKVQVIPGNHDGNLEALLPKDVDILPQRGVIIGEMGLFHGHTWPDLSMLSCRTLVVGHVHPVVTFKDPLGFRITGQVWVKAPCEGDVLARFLLKRHGVKLTRDEAPRDILKTKFNIDLKVDSLLIMPSFNDFLGGRPINISSSMTREKEFEEFIGPVLRSGSVNLEEAEIYLLDGTFLGHLRSLRALS